jgi:hypothetical protein
VEYGIRSVEFSLVMRSLQQVLGPGCKCRKEISREELLQEFLQLLEYQFLPRIEPSRFYFFASHLFNSLPNCPDQKHSPESTRLFAA